MFVLLVVFFYFLGKKGALSLSDSPKIASDSRQM